MTQTASYGFSYHAWRFISDISIWKPIAFFFVFTHLFANILMIQRIKKRKNESFLEA